MANLPIKDNPTLNLQMEALTTSTPGHADRFNERYQQLLENDKALQVDAKVYEDDKNGAKIRPGNGKWSSLLCPASFGRS